MTPPDHAAAKLTLAECKRQATKAKRVMNSLPKDLRDLFEKEREAFFNDPHRYD